MKEYRRLTDPRKKDLSPSLLDFGPVQFFIPRHFGFCYGVENAIEISYKALRENPDKRVFLLSQMIHNQIVNKDLEEKGIRFIQDTEGNQFIDFDELTREDVVIIPAFGTTIQIEQKLREKGLEIQQYNTTCPFVEKVWKRSEKLGKSDYTVIIHGKHNHEETRATFSHSQQNAPSVVIRDMEEAKMLGSIIEGEYPYSKFYEIFEGKYTANFDPTKHLNRVGVVNQTTMLAEETQSIADYFKKVMIRKFGNQHYKDHFADTRDTLCYATNDNQDATYELRDTKADLAIVVGGYNSSNTSHIVELCENSFPTYYINSPREIISSHKIRHFIPNDKETKVTQDFLSFASPVKIVLTSGASCPDTLVDAVMRRLLECFEDTRTPDDVVQEMVVSE